MARLSHPQVLYRTLVLVLGASAAPFLGGGWVSDDFVHIARLLTGPTVLQIFSSPDPFGFYRPLAHSALLGDAIVWGFSPVMFRISNLAVHLLVIAAAHQFARGVLSERAAFLAALAFVLTPKAHTIAIFWPSARPELLMSACSFVALLCWLRWEQGGARRWLVAAGVAYVAAFLSKETAALLPVLMLFTPPAGPLLTRRRILGVAVLLALGAAPMLLRMASGALMPLSTDEHYKWVFALSRWIRGARIYLLRAVPSPAALIALVAGPAAFSLRGRSRTNKTADLSLLRLALYGIVWFLVFIAPVLPVVARSELYLYLPGFGLCLAAGHVTARLWARLPSGRLLPAMLTIYVAGLAGYQVALAIQSHQVTAFTAAFTRGIRDDPWVRSYHGDVVLVPGDSRTERLLRDGISGYLNVVFSDTFGRTHIFGTIAYADASIPAGNDPRVVCIYDGRQVHFRPPR